MTDTISIHITEANHSPVRLHLDAEGKTYESVVVVGADADIPKQLLAILETTPDIKWRYANEAGDSKPAAARDGFDAEKILDGTVKDVSGRLSKLDADQLDALRDAEKNGQDRKGVHDAIDSEVGSRNDGTDPSTKPDGIMKQGD